MNAQIFYLRSQKDLYREISPLLKRYIFEEEGIEIDPRMIDDDSIVRRYQSPHFESYMHLLKASMISTDDDFTLQVEDSEGNWCYIGYQPWKNSANLLRLFKKSITSVLPAVSVMDRVVMAPKGIHDALTAENFSWMLKPLEMGGVLLVDFHDPESVREVARQVGIRLRKEIAKLCRRHMLINKSASPNFDTLSELLRIDKSYLEKRQDEILASMVKLTPQIVSGPARLGKLSRVVLDIRNESEKELAGVRVQVRAPKDAMTASVVKTLDFSSAREQRLQFDVSPKAIPYCPLEVLFEISETSQLFAPFSAPLILDVSP